MTQSTAAVVQEESEISWSELRDEWNRREIDKIRSKLEIEYQIPRSDLKYVCEYEEPEVDHDETVKQADDLDAVGSFWTRLFRRNDSASSDQHIKPAHKINVDERIENTWKRIWLTAAEKNADPLVAYFVFALGMKKWELSSEHDAVKKSMAHAIKGYRGAHGFGRDKSASSEMAELILDELVQFADSGSSVHGTDRHSGPLLEEAMGVESAVYSGSSKATHARANRIATNCELYLQEAVFADHAEHADDCCSVECLVRYVIDLHRIYYGCIANIAAAVRAAGDIDPTVGVEITDLQHAIGEINHAVSELTDARTNLGNDVYASELPPYFATLSAWRDKLSCNSATPIVALKDVDITYVYPFALADVDVDKVQRFMRELVFDDHSNTILSPNKDRSGAVAVFRPGNLVPKAPMELDLNDMWTWGGRRKELNATVGIEMPSITVRLIDDDRFVWKFNVELLFNDLGNHYLRVKLEAKEQRTLDELNQALRLATTYCGDHVLRSEGDNPVLKENGSHCRTVADYAKSVIDDVSTWIVREAENWKDPDDPEEGMKPAQFDSKFDQAVRKRHYESGFQPDFDYHVLVVIGGAGAPGSDHFDMSSIKSEIERGYGDLFMQLLNREATTLDEWTCRGRYNATSNLLGDECFPSDFAMGTATTTVLYMPATPSWVQSGYEEVAEFAASFRPLINEAKKDLEDKLENIEGFIQTDDDHELDAQEERLRYLRRDLHVLLDRMRKIRTYLEPSQLLSLRAEGEFLARLYEQLKLDKLRGDLDGYLDRGRITIDRMNRRESRLHDHRSRHYEDSIQKILLFVGVVSFSGFLSLVLTVTYGANIPGWDTDTDGGDGHPLKHHFSWPDIIGASALYLLVVAVVVIYFKRESVAKHLKRIGRW